MSIQTPRSKEGVQDSRENATIDAKDEEKEVLNQQLAIVGNKTSYLALYRFADGRDILLILICSICSVAAGLALPLMTVVFGNFTGSFAGFKPDTAFAEEYRHKLATFTLYFVYLGIGQFVTTYISTAGFNHTGERLTQKIREAYIRAVLRQNIAFFDSVGAGEITARITGDMTLIQDGLSQKVGLVITGMATFVGGIVVSFIKSWKMAFIMLSGVVSIVLALGGLGSLMKRLHMQAISSSASNNVLAEEAIASIKSVSAYGAQPRIIAKYEKQQATTSRLDLKAKASLGLMIATSVCLMNLMYGLGFWQGGRFVAWGDANLSQIMTVLLASFLAGVTFGQTAPHLGAFAVASAAGSKVLNTISRQSPIDVESDEGRSPEFCKGHIMFRNVKLIYPSRPNYTVLQDFSLVVPAGKMTALVGPSGSGKSSLVGLLERFYLPLSGEIYLDNTKITDLNLKWLRNQMSLVSQEPVLFADTIYNNIAFGLLGTVYEHMDLQTKTAMVVEAAKTANAHEFIRALKDGYQMNVGQRGSLLSGGQRQRIAIARAIVSRPKILLLDEATAALDTRSERVVQAALDEAAKNRTTIVIAHRLSTIRKADNIVVLESGRIAEQGTHDMLMAQNGVYRSLVQAQQMQEDKSVDDEHRSIATEDPEENATTDKKHGIEDDIEVGFTDSLNDESHAAPDMSLWQAVRFIWALNKPEQSMLWAGFAAAFVAGLFYPVQAIFYGNSIIAIAGGRPDGGHGVNFWAAMLLMLGFACLVLMVSHGLAFAAASANLVTRARQAAFRSILRQDISFFDLDENSPGALASFLSIESNHLAGVSGATLGALFTFLATISGAIVVGSIYGWKLTLVAIAVMPVLISTGFCRMWSLAQLEKRTKQKTEAASFACEATSAIRTVASLGIENHIWQTYHDKLEEQSRRDFRFSSLSAVLYALSQATVMFSMALSFGFGGSLILRQEYSIKEFFICFCALVWGSQAAGNLFSYAPDFLNAKSAAQKLRNLLEKVPAIDSSSLNGLSANDLNGDIEFQQVQFAYPNRPDQKVLKGVDLMARRGEFIALVGASGCGKSTAISLLERFYDATSGVVKIDGIDIRKYNLQKYRRNVALVSQETTLLSGTIRENILADDEDVSQDTIEAACRAANIHDFIISLPEGYNTHIGTKGSLLSGGQRQRLAIARALLRNPKILLLDEATSALDSASESAVQAALDQAAYGRTTIAIAHRLSTIQHADRIYVFDAGQIAEQGTHYELMARRGLYWGLVQGQEMSQKAEQLTGS